jgi:hypothetical protein
MTASARSILFPNDPDPQSKYLREHEQAEAVRAEAKRSGVSQSQLTALCAEVVRLSAKTDAQAATIAEMQKASIDAIGKIGDMVGSVVGELIAKASSKLETKLLTEIATKFGEVRGEAIGMVRALDPAAVRSKAAEPFRFAGVEPETHAGTTLPALVGDVH